MSNVVNVAKSYFPGRVTNIDVNLLRDLEGAASQPDEVRQKIYNRLDRVMNTIVNENMDQAERIRNKTFYKPGGGVPTTAATTASTTAPTTALTAAPTTAAPASPGAIKPTLSQFMEKARTANPGAKDSDLAQFWKQKYGG
jgi:hypothetical protein